MLSGKIHLLSGFLVMCIGAFVLGFGIKFSWVWWPWLPNIIDGFLTIIAGLILVLIGFFYTLRMFPKKESQ